MTTPTPPHQAAIRAAEKIDDLVCLQESSSPTVDSMAQIITREYESMIEDSKVLVLNLTIETCPVCNGFGRKLNAATCERCNGCGEIVPQSIWPADLRAVKKALQQLTKE